MVILNIEIGQLTESKHVYSIRIKEKLLTEMLQQKL